MAPGHKGGETRRQAPQLYLVTPRTSDANALAAPLATALAAADFAAVLLRLPELDERGLINLVKAVAPSVQEHGTALVLDGHPELVARAGADGAHLGDIAALQAAIASLKPDRIAGVGGLTTRHDAMLAGEAGADYIMFGEPDAAGQRPAFPAVLDRIEWWSEVFEIPCVGYAGDAEEAAALAQAGADFIALGDFVWNDVRGTAALLASLAERLRSVELV